MKEILILLSLLLFFASCVSILTVENTKVENQQIIKLKINMNKNEIFEKTKIWFTTNFGNTNTIIEYENKNESRIIGSTNLKAKCLGIYSDCKYQVSMKVDVKNRRIRVSFIDVYFIYSNGERTFLQNQMYDDYKKATDNLVSLFIYYIENGGIINNNDDW